MGLKFPELLCQSDLVLDTIPNVEDIDCFIKKRAKGGRPIRVMYGETYDRLGHTLGSIKYYFFVAAIGRLLRNQDIEVEPTILIADVATCRNEPKEYYNELMLLGRKRATFVEMVSEVYDLELNVLLMSDYLYSNDFQDRLQCVREKAKTNPNVSKWVRQTVPPSKVDIEADKGFAYAFDEIATIIGYDVKIGPPREKFYDEPARSIGRALGLFPLLSVYLHPTYPLGFGRGFFFRNKEIEEYGVTAYKAGSKGLESHRVIIGETSLEDLDSLVTNTVISRNLKIPNPVLDLAVIAEMAKQLFDGKLQPMCIRERFYKGNVSVEELKNMAVTQLDKYILQPLASAMEDLE